MTMKYLVLLARLVAAAVLLQTLCFKFSGASESVAIFTALGVEPWGRYAAGVSELVAAILLLVPQTQGCGGLLALGIMAGAIASHLTVLGIDSFGDGGLLFSLALVVFGCAALVVFADRRRLYQQFNLLRGR